MVSYYFRISRSSPLDCEFSTANWIQAARLCFYSITISVIVDLTVSIVLMCRVIVSFKSIKGLGSDFYNYIINAIYFADFYYARHFFQFVYELLFSSNIIIDQNICCWHTFINSCCSLYQPTPAGGFECPGFTVFKSLMRTLMFQHYQMICHTLCTHTV